MVNQIVFIEIDRNDRTYTPVEERVRQREREEQRAEPEHELGDRQGRAVVHLYVTARADGAVQREGAERQRDPRDGGDVVGGPAALVQPAERHRA